LGRELVWRSRKSKSNVSIMCLSLSIAAASIEVEKQGDQKKYCIHPSRDFVEALQARLGLGFSFSDAYIANGWPTKVCNSTLDLNGIPTIQ
jgi:hypothetical protein